ncbi:MAG TPA: hypothetical protein PLN94_18600, partial [Thiolinea sp.]|nr:hypothetical protein [Thiolinea sp.]
GPFSTKAASAPEELGGHGPGGGPAGGTGGGLQTGRKEEKLDIARNLLELLDDATIASKTGLTLVAVQALCSAA